VRNQRWAKLAPVLIIVLARKVNDEGAANGAAHYDTGAAVARGPSILVPARMAQ